MIYSEDIERRCGLCRYSRPGNDDECYCEKKKKSLPQSREACKKFSYDILKKTVRRRKKIRQAFDAEDFSLE